MSVKMKIAIYFAFQFVVLICSANFERNQINAATNQTIPLITGTLQSMKRAITTSQVLTFNLTNFFILVVLKAIVIVAGILGKISFWKYPGLGGIRSFSSSFPFNNIESTIYDSIYSDEDMRWSSTFIWAINKNDFGCLFRLACENHKSAQIYLNAGRIFNRAAKSLFSILMLSYNRRYEDILVGIQEALDTREDQCRNKYTCRAPFDKLKLIIIWAVLLDSFQFVFMHEIEDKFESMRLNRSYGNSYRTESMVATMRGTPAGSFTFLAVSLLFQLPLMEIVFVMGLIVLVLGIILHFVELKAEFFRLRRQHARELLRNRTLETQMSNSSESQFANNYGDGDYPHYHNNYPYDDNHNRDYLYSQSTSNLYSSYQRPPSMPYRQPNRPFPRFPSLRFNNYRQNQNQNHPNFYRQRLPNRHSISNYRNQNSKRQGYQHYSQSLRTNKK